MTENDPKPIPRKTPKKKGDGPSMREQILARKRAEAAAAAGAEAEAPAAEPEEAPEKAPEKASAKPARKAGAKRSGARSSRGSSRSSRRGKDEGGDGEESGRRSGRGRRERPKKKSPVPMLVGGLVLLLAAGGAFALLGGEDEAPVEDGTEVAGASEAGEAGADAGTPAADETPAADAGAGAAADAGEAAPEPEPEPEPEVKKPEPPADVDLSALEPFGKPADTTDEQWADLQEDAATFFDIDAGAASTRAQRRLEAAGKAAWPAILNEMIKLDPGKPEDNQQGMLAQRALNAARGSSTSMAFDWRTPDDGVLSEKNLRYNKKLIKALYDSWAKVVEDPSHWDRINKAEASAEAKADTEKKLEEAFEFDPSDLEGLDG